MQLIRHKSFGLKNRSPTTSMWIFINVRREANLVTHEVVKFFLPFSPPFTCNSDSLSPSVKEAWIRDILAVGSAS